MQAYSSAWRHDIILITWLSITCLPLIWGKTRLLISCCTYTNISFVSFFKTHQPMSMLLYYTNLLVNGGSCEIYKQPSCVKEGLKCHALVRHCSISVELRQKLSLLNLHLRPGNLKERKPSTGFV